MSATKKFNDWCKLFLDPKSESRGNATQSALKAYRTKNYHSAGQIGYENLKKLELTGLSIMEMEGFSVRDWYKMAASKAIKGSYEQTIDFMRVLGILPKDKNASVNQINQQFNFADLADTYIQARNDRGLTVDSK